MSDTPSNPFAEPDFSSLRAAEDSGADEEYSDDEGDEAAPAAGTDHEDEDDDDGENEDGEDEDGEDEAGNRVRGGTARSVLEHVARSIVDEPDGVTVEVSEGRGGVKLSLHVAQGDMGRIIGRRGRTAQALRTLVRAAAARDDQEASVDIVD